MKKNVIERILQKTIRDLDHEKKSLATKEEELTKLQLDLQKSLDCIEKEKKLVIDYPHLHGFGEFFELEQKKQTIIKNNINQATEEMSLIRDQLRNILAEQKKYEYILKKIELKELKKQEKIERDILDSFNNRAEMI